MMIATPSWNAHVVCWRRNSPRRGTDEGRARRKQNGDAIAAAAVALGELRTRRFQRWIGSARPGGNANAAADAIEAAAAELDDAMAKLRAAGDVETARQLVRDGLGVRVGALDKAMEQGAATCQPHERALLDIVRNQVIGRAIGELLAACRWDIKSDKAG